MKLAFTFITLAGLIMFNTACRMDSGEIPSQKPPGPELEPIVKSNNAFAFDLYRELRKKGDKNLFFSPYSISSALAMTSAGARTHTEKEMADVLHFNLERDELHPLLGQFTRYLDAGKGRQYQLSVANRLWPKEGLAMLETFQEIVRAHYGADITPLNYSTDAESSRKTINQWVEKQTNDRIKDLIKPGILRPSTALVLTNAIYFKGDWAVQFKQSATRKAPFHRTPDQQVDVSMMSQTEEFRFRQIEDLKILELPYRGDALSMLLLLPEKAGNIGELEAKLNEENLTAWTTGMEKQEVDVSLPRFKMTTEFELAPTLTSMGMGSAFNDADFSGITGSRDLVISNVIHKAFVEVNEEGTEAAAATAVVMVESAMMSAEFRADHPFIFLIRDKHTGGILFMGKVVDPR